MIKSSQKMPENKPAYAGRKVLIFSTAFLPLIGGAEIAVKEITDRLPDDWQFDMLTAKIKPGLAKFEKIGNISVYRLGWGKGALDKLFLPFLGLFRAVALNKTQRYSFIWAIMASFGGLAALFFKMRNPKMPFLLTLQEGDTPEHIQKKARWLGPFFKMIFRKADYIQAISHYLLHWARSLGAKCPGEVVPNGVDLTKIKNEKLRQESRVIGQNIKNTNRKLKNKLGIKEDEKVIVTVSRLVEKNGIGDLIEAAYYCSSKIRLKSDRIENSSFSTSRHNFASQIWAGRSKNNLVFFIIGDGPEKPKLEKLIKKYNLQNKVFLLGQIPHDELPKYYAIADVFVRPSLSEGLGNAFLEAMAAGVPIIGTPVGGIPDYLKDGETGFFCEVRNPKSIAEKIKILLEDESLRLRLAENGRKLVQEKYGWDKIAQQMEAIFEKL